MREPLSVEESLDITKTIGAGGLDENAIVKVACFRLDISPNIAVQFSFV